jgi:hypothetical protein
MEDEHAAGRYFFHLSISDTLLCNIQVLNNPRAQIFEDRKNLLTSTSTLKIAITIGFGATTMLKKRSHNHYFYQTKHKNQPKPETNLKKQPEKMLRTENSYNNSQRKRILYEF